jgi:hypothetical protein
MGNWTPDGFVGDFFRLVGKYAPPPDMPSPLLWGEEEVVMERLGKGASTIEVVPSKLQFYYPMPPESVARYYLKYFGPTRRAAELLNPEERAEFESALGNLFFEANYASDGNTKADGEIIQVTAIKD